MNALGVGAQGLGGLSTVLDVKILDYPTHAAIYEFDVHDMPVTVAVDATGESVHETGPREWRQRIGRIPIAAS